MGMEKRGQAWGFDLMIATSLFFVGVAALYIYSLNYPIENQDTGSAVSAEAERIGSIIISEGYPLNWTIENVVRPGIISEDKIDEYKLEMLNELGNNDYNRLKSLLRTKYNFYLYFSEDMIIAGTNVSGIGRAPNAEKNLIKESRIIIYKNKPINAYLYIWE